MVDAITNNGTFRVGELEADRSPPHLIPEVESTDSRDIVNYLDSIRKIKTIEEQVLNNRKLIHNLIDKMSVLGENQEDIISVISKMVGPGKIDMPDTFVDVV